MISITVCPDHCNIEKAVPWAVVTPYMARPNITAMFQGPRPPLEGTAMPIELSTNATKQGNNPKALPGAVQRSRVKSKAKKAT